MSDISGEGKSVVFLALTFIPHLTMVHNLKQIKTDYIIFEKMCTQIYTGCTYRQSKHACMISLPSFRVINEYNNDGLDEILIIIILTYDVCWK